MRGAWIEIFSANASIAKYASRSPCGERGLKFFRLQRDYQGALSLPVRGAWIEIVHDRVSARFQRVAPRAGSVD